MQLKRAHATLLATLVAGVVYPLSALADMFVWTDKEGATHISNLPPPDGVRLVSVTRAQPKDPAQDAVLRETETARQAEMRVLSERVQQLQSQVEEARRDPPPAIVVPQHQYEPNPSVTYVIVVAPPAPATAPCMRSPSAAISHGAAAGLDIGRASTQRASS